MPRRSGRVGGAVHRWATAAAIVVLAAGALVAAPRAIGDPGDVLTPAAWGVEGWIDSIAVVGTTAYVGGDFDRVGLAHPGLAAVDATTGAHDADWPAVAGSVATIVGDGAGGWFVGGRFARIGGVARSNLAHVLADGTVDGWNPSPDEAVVRLLRDGGTLYVAGDFSTIGGQARAGLAAVDTTTGAATAFDPAPDGSARDLVLDGTTLYVGGGFSTIGGQARNRLAAIDTTTGVPTAFAPDMNNETTALAVDGTRLYVGGEFTAVGPTPRGYLASFDLATGALDAWDPDVSLSVGTLALDGTTLYVGGNFDDVGGVPRSNLAAVDTGTGAVTPWNPGSTQPVFSLAVDGATVYAGGFYDATIGGQVRLGAAALDATTGLATAWDPDAADVQAFAPAGGTIYLGGFFTVVGGVPRSGLAAIDLTTGEATSWDPGPDGDVEAVAAHGDRLYVGGSFATIAGQPRGGLAAIDLGTGALTAWDPGGEDDTATALVASGDVVYVAGRFDEATDGFAGVRALDASTGETIFDVVTDDVPATLAVAGDTLYFGGWFEEVGGQPRSFLAAVDADTGALRDWDPQPDEGISALGVAGGTLYAGGWFEQIGGQGRSYLAAFDTATGALTGWDPGADDGVDTLAIADTAIYVGGVFAAAGGQARELIAALDPDTGAALAWDARALRATRHGVWRLAFTADSDLLVAGAFLAFGDTATAGLASVERVAGATAITTTTRATTTTTITTITTSTTSTTSTTTTTAPATTTPTTGGDRPTRPSPPPAPPGTTGARGASSRSATETAIATAGRTTVTATGVGAYTVAEFPDDPSSVAPFRSTAGYFDVRLAERSAYPSLSITTCGLTASDSVFWWDGSRWARASDQTFADGCITVTVSASSSPGLGDLGGTPFAVGTVQAQRVAGPDRTTTAVAASQAAFPEPGSATGAVVVGVDAIADALVGGPLAAAVGGPLLLAPGRTTNGAVLAELGRVLPAGSTVHVLGGTGALPGSVEDDIRRIGLIPVRVAGADRQATALAAAEHIAGPEAVYLVDGADVEGGVSAGAAAAARGGAVLFTRAGMLGAPVARWRAAHPDVPAYAVGAVAATADPDATPLTGADRYATAVALARTVDERPSGLVAAGSVTDAVVAATIAGAHGEPLLLVPRSGPMPAAVASYAVGATSVARLTAVGGTAAAPTTAVAGLVRAVVGGASSDVAVRAE